jgi:hypothetical protein
MGNFTLKIGKFSVTNGFVYLYPHITTLSTLKTKPSYYGAWRSAHPSGSQEEPHVTLKIVIYSFTNGFIYLYPRIKILSTLKWFVNLESMQDIYFSGTNAELSIEGKLMRQFLKINKNSFCLYQGTQVQIRPTLGFKVSIFKLSFSYRHPLNDGKNRRN